MKAVGDAIRIISPGLPNWYDLVTISVECPSGASHAFYPRLMSFDSRQRTRSRILVADDHAIVVEGICAILEKSYEVVGVAKDGRELLAKASLLKPDALVVDVNMPLLNGFDAALKVKESLPKIGLVFLTMLDDRNLAAAALEIGAVGYVLKSAAGTELLKAISEVLLGRSYVTPSLKPDNWAVQKERAQQFSRDLSPRQREVLQLLAEGRPMKEVASILSVSEKTVNFHKYHLMHVFNLKNNTDLVLFALNQGLISR